MNDEVIHTAIDEINSQSYEIRNNDKKQSVAFADKAIQLSEQANYPSGLATGLSNRGFALIQSSEYEEAVHSLQRALGIFTSLHHEEGIANACYNLGLIFIRFGDYSVALDYLNRSLEIRKKNNDKIGTANCYFQIGYIYQLFKDFDNALKFYEESQALHAECKNESGLAAQLMGKSFIYIERGDKEEAAKCLEDCLEIRKRFDDIKGMGSIFYAFMLFNMKFENYPLAVEYGKKAMEITLQTNDRMSKCRISEILGRAYFMQKMNEESIQVFNEAIIVATEAKLKSSLPELYKGLSEVYRSAGKFPEALDSYILYHEKKEEVMNADAAVKVKHLNIISKIEAANQEAEIYRLKNVDLKIAYELVEEKQKEILDSIHYAKRIQGALLASENLLKKYIPEFFILFKPKDIVSGDFYWATEKQGRFYLAVCDSTGHGVPGAFMSLLNITYLNEAISEKGIANPNEAFNFVRKRLIDNVSQEGGQDGMDGIVVCIQNDTLSYAASNNAPLLIRDNKMIELQVDKMPIGKSPKEQLSFSHHSIDIKKGDVIYLLTDGYADQFGGSKGKKFKHRQLEEVLLSIHSKPMQEQKITLSDILENWKGNLEQIDDICLIGIKF